MGKDYDYFKYGLEAFNEAAEVLHREAVKLGEGKHSPDKLVIPETIMLAFSCEIALKALLVKRGIEYKKGHCLSGIFKLLLSEDKNAIVNQMLQECGKKNYDENVFMNDLKDVSNLFEKMRYFFEVEEDIHFNIIFLLQFNKVLNEYIQSLN